MVSWKKWAHYLVVLLFRGIFSDILFARSLLAAFTAPGQDLELLTVIADTRFEFPSLDPHAKVEVHVDSESMPDMELLHQVAGHLWVGMVPPYT